jgi:hypothetical protein
MSATRSAGDEAGPAPGRRRVLVWGLIVLALVVLIVASLTVWVRRQALNTDAWTKTSSSLLQDEQIRAALAVYLVDQLYARGDIEGRLAANLPAGLQGLAAPFAGAIRGPAQQTAEAFLGRPRVQTAWEDANRLAHERLLAVLNGHPRDNVSTANGDVTLDLRPMVVSVGGEMGLGQALDSSLPADAGQITILKSNELKNAQRAVKGVKALSWVFGVAAFVLWGWLSGSRPAGGARPCAVSARASWPAGSSCSSCVNSRATTSWTRSRRPARPATPGTRPGFSAARSSPRSAGPASSTGLPC